VHFTRASPDDWVAHAGLNAIAVAIILHVPLHDPLVHARDARRPLTSAAPRFSASRYRAVPPRRAILVVVALPSTEAGRGLAVVLLNTG
jgi:hypothetical protein